MHGSKIQIIGTATKLMHTERDWDGLGRLLAPLAMAAAPLAWAMPCVKSKQHTPKNDMSAAVPCFIAQIR